MIFIFTYSLLLHILIVFAGLALIQIFSVSHRIRIFYNLPYAWGAGVALLYILGNVFVRLEILPHHWHWIILILFLLIIACGVIFHLKARHTNGTQPLPPRSEWIRPVPIVMIGLMTFKISLVTIICLTHPIIDADAFMPQGYIPIAKALIHGRTLSQALQPFGGDIYSSLSPSILTAWPNMFMDRWYISFAALPWFFCYLSIILLGWNTAFRISQKLIPSLMLALIFALTPLLVIHTIRPGYHDALVAFFLMMSLSLLTQKLLTAESMSAADKFLVMTSIIGLLLSKVGGLLFSPFVAGLWINLYLSRRYNVTLLRLLKIEIFMIAAGFTVFVVLNSTLIEFLGRYLPDVYLTEKIKKMYPVLPDWMHFSRLSDHLFNWSSFSIMWWMNTSFVVALMLSWRQLTEAHITLIVSACSIFAFVSYIATFTVLSYSEDATTTGRFFLQIIGITIPIFCVYVDCFLKDSA